MKQFFTLACTVLLSAYSFAQGPWTQAYNNGSTNQIDAPNFNYIEAGPDGAMYLAEQILAGATDYSIRVQRFENDEWTVLGAPIATELYDAATAHFDFKVTPEGMIYVGVADAIYTYDTDGDLWVELPAPDYIGGLTYIGGGDFYFISRQEGASGAAHSNLILSLLQADGTIQNLETIASNIEMVPVVMSRSNQVALRNDAIHVCVHAASTDGLFFFRGNLDFGITPLQPLSQQPALIADLGLSSMVVAPNGTIIVSRKAGDDLAMAFFEQFGSGWEPYATDGINATSCQVNQLRYDNNGVLHLIYSGSNGTGFIFAEEGSAWAHIGATDLPGLLSVEAPHLAFDAENEIYFVSGIGSQQAPLIVRTTAEVSDVTVSTSERSAPGSLRLYPNPARDFFTLDFSEAGQSSGSQAVQIRIFGANGKLYHSAQHPRSSAIIAVSSLAPGVYILMAETDNGVVYREKLVVY